MVHACLAAACGGVTMRLCPLTPRPVPQCGSAFVCLTHASVSPLATVRQDTRVVLSPCVDPYVCLNSCVVAFLCGSAAGHACAGGAAGGGPAEALPPHAPAPRHHTTRGTTNAPTALLAQITTFVQRLFLAKNIHTFFKQRIHTSLLAPLLAMACGPHLLIPSSSLRGCSSSRHACCSASSARTSCACRPHVACGTCCSSPRRPTVVPSSSPSPTPSSGYLPHPSFETKRPLLSERPFDIN